MTVENNERRKIVRAGLVATPFLVALPGRSAMAGNNCTVSGNLSGNLSTNVGNDDICLTYGTGISVDAWNNSTNFPLDMSLQFSDVFGGFNAMTLHDVLLEGELSLDAQALAAVLNAMTISLPPMQVVEIVDAYNEYVDINPEVLMTTFLYINGA